MIREYQPGDCEAVLDVWARASAVAHPFLSDAFLERERHKIPEEYLPRAETWVWESDGGVLGFISLLGNEIGALFVDPRCHRSGIGRELMNRARARRGELEVEVFERNVMGREFNAKMGFEPAQQRLDTETGFKVIRLRWTATGRMEQTGQA